MQGSPVGLAQQVRSSCPPEDRLAWPRQGRRKGPWPSVTTHGHLHRWVPWSWMLGHAGIRHPRIPGSSRQKIRRTGLGVGVQ